MTHFKTLVLCAGICLVLTGCDGGRPAWKTYRETVAADAAPSADRQVAPPAAGRWQWTAPEGWTEEAGSGMRLGTLVTERAGRTGTCTVIALGAAAGDVDANVRRWIGQLRLEAPPGDELSSFMDRQERFRSEGGFDGVIVDLTTLGGQSPESASMLAAMVSTGDATIFFKLSGPVALLQDQRPAFGALCRSLRRAP